MAAAIGAGLPVQEPTGNMIVDIGGGTTEVAVISLGGIVASQSVRVGGDELDEAIIQFIKKEYSLALGERTAEEVKIALGSAWPLEEELHAEIRGRDLVTGLPKTIVTSTEEIREAIEEPVVGDRRRREGHPRQDPARAGRRHHGAGHRRSPAAARCSTASTRASHARDRHADRASRRTRCTAVAIGSGQSLEEFEALKDVLFSSSEPLTRRSPAMASSRRHRRPRPGSRSSLLVLTSVTVLTLDFRGSAGRRAARHRGVPRVLGPVRDAADAGRPSPFANAWHGITGYGDLKSENDQPAPPGRRARRASRGARSRRQPSSSPSCSSQQDLDVGREHRDRGGAGCVAGSPSNFDAHDRQLDGAPTTASPSACRWSPGPGWSARSSRSPGPRRRCSSSPTRTSRSASGCRPARSPASARGQGRGERPARGDPARARLGARSPSRRRPSPPAASTAASFPADIPVGTGDARSTSPAGGSPIDLLVGRWPTSTSSPSCSVLLLGTAGVTAREPPGSWRCARRCVLAVAVSLQLGVAPASTCSACRRDLHAAGRRCRRHRRRARAWRGRRLRGRPRRRPAPADPVRADRADVRLVGYVVGAFQDGVAPAVVVDPRA